MNVVSAQDFRPKWEWQNPLPQGNSIFAIRFAGDKLTGWAVGADGTILYTRDGGFNWRRQSSPVSNTLSGIFIKDKKTAIIAGGRGTILLTDDAGETWREIKLDGRDHFYAVAFAPKNFQKGWAVGSYGAIYQTSDGGLTWSK
ncbi:MAG TPA: YCF48-related protein, partial [Pyrinomonadaceae bacterium]